MAIRKKKSVKKKTIKKAAPGKKPAQLKKKSPGKKKSVVKKESVSKKKISVKKKVSPRKKAGAGKPVLFEDKRFTLTDGKTTVTYEIRFYGGAGSLVLEGTGISRTDSCDNSFSVEQPSGRQRTDVGGNAPASTEGRIEVQVSKDGVVLSPFSENIFREKVISDFIKYSI